MKNSTLRILAFSALAMILAACSGGGGGGSGSPTTAPLIGPFIDIRPDQVQFFKNGQMLGTLYIEGSCDGSDNQGQNVTSLDSNGRMLRSRQGGCVDASPFRISASKISEDAVIIDINIGPAVKNLKTISIPLDPPGKFFGTFSSGASGYWYGCAFTWSWRSGSTPSFATIPTPCFIQNVGPVGVARTNVTAAWGEITSVYGTIRRTLNGGNCGELLFYNHPHTNNIERGFSSKDRDMNSNNITLPAGQTLICREEIQIR